VIERIGNALLHVSNFGVSVDEYIYVVTTLLSVRPTHPNTRFWGMCPTISCHRSYLHVI